VHAESCRRGSGHASKPLSRARANAACRASSTAVPAADADISTRVGVGVGRCFRRSHRRRRRRRPHRRLAIYAQTTAWSAARTAAAPRPATRQISGTEPTRLGRQANGELPLRLRLAPRDLYLSGLTRLLDWHVPRVRLPDWHPPVRPQRCWPHQACPHTYLVGLCSRSAPHWLAREPPASIHTGVGGVRISPRWTQPLADVHSGGRDCASASRRAWVAEVASGWAWPPRAAGRGRSCRCRPGAIGEAGSFGWVPRAPP